MFLWLFDIFFAEFIWKEKDMDYIKKSEVYFCVDTPSSYKTVSVQFSPSRYLFAEIRQFREVWSAVYGSEPNRSTDKNIRMVQGERKSKRQWSG